jgi:hypothetical protein
MTIFTQHPHDQGITYFEHCCFAMGIAWRLSRSVVAFALHALLPWSKIEKQLDLEATSAYLLDRNDFIEAAADAGRTQRDTRALAV